MAIDDPVEDKDKEEEGEGEGETKKPKKKGKLLKIIIIVVSVLVLVGGTVGGTMYFTGAFSSDESSVADESSDTAEGDAKDTKDGKGKKDKKGKDSKKKAKSPPNYYAFDPAFIVNFVENNQIRYLQITMEIMTHDETVIEDIKTHMPVIRNNLVLVFSNQTYDTLSTAAGKQKMRDEALAEMQQILKNETGKAGVEAVYFTSFVMQ